MSDFRDYAGVDFSSQFLAHYGVGHDKGGHSGRYPWGSGKNPRRNRPLSDSYDVASAKRDYKRAKRKKKYLNVERKEKRVHSDDAYNEYLEAKSERTSIFNTFDTPEDKERYKRAKREKKYSKAVAKEMAARYKDAKEDLEDAKENLKAEKQRVKGQRAGMKDAWTVLDSGKDGDGPSRRDIKAYIKRHPDEVDTFFNSVLSMIGGVKVSSEYKEAYEKEFDEWIKYADQYYDEETANKLKDSYKNLKVRSA